MEEVIITHRVRGGPRTQGQGLTLQILLPCQGALEPDQPRAYKSFSFVGCPCSGDSVLIPQPCRGKQQSHHYKMSGGGDLNMGFPLLGETLAIPLTPEMPLFYIFPSCSRPGRANTRHRCSLAFPLLRADTTIMALPAPV